MLCWAADGMGKAMNGFKNCPCPFSREYWSRFTHGDITKDGTVIELDVVKMKASDGGLIGSNFV